MFAPGEAHAGAWIAPPDGQEIWTNTAGERGDLEYFETSAYFEIPFTAANFLVAAPWVEQAEDVGDKGWRAEATLGVKHALLRSDHAAMAVEAGAVWRSEPHANCSEGAREARWLGGVSWGGSSFVNLEAGARVELTAGYRPAPQWLGMAQIFVDEPKEGETDVKLQLTLVHFNDEDKGVQIGLRTRISGGDAEPALVIGFWGKPKA